MKFLRNKPQIKNPDIAKIKASFKYEYKAVIIGYGEGARFLSVDEFLKFAKDHEVEDVFIMSYHTYTEFFFHYNGLTYSKQIKNMENLL